MLVTAWVVTPLDDWLVTGAECIEGRLNPIDYLTNWQLCSHNSGHYSFLPVIAPSSAGVADCVLPGWALFCNWNIRWFTETSLS